MKTYIGPGSTLPVTAPYDVLSGQGCRVGKLFGLATGDALSGATVEIKRDEVHLVTQKLTGTAWAQGDEIFWDNSAKKFTVVTTSPNMWVGIATKAALSAAASGEVLLLGFGIQDPAAASG